MGFLDKVGNWFQTTGRKVFDGVRGGISTGYHAVQNISHKVGQVANGIDNFLTQAKSIPVVGELANALQNHPYYQMAKEGINTANNAIDKAGNIGSEVNKILDSALPK